MNEIRLIRASFSFKFVNQVDVQACLLDSFVYNNVKKMEK